MTVHISRRSHDGFFTVDYCERCSRFHANDSQHLCTCGKSFNDFLQNGLLGCEKCYDAFSEKLDLLLIQYRGRATAAYQEEPILSDSLRLASARTAELQDILFYKDAENKNTENSSQYKNHSLNSIENPFKKGIKSRNPFILSLRIRIARNIAGIPYLIHLNENQKNVLSDILLSKKNVLYSWLQKKKDSIQRKIFSGDEDHIRAEWILHEIPSEIDRIPEIVFHTLDEIHEMNQFYQWQFHRNYGYLTSCPGNSGTGLRVSFKIHVGGLKSSGIWLQWKKNLKDAGLVIRGSRGEGSRETEIVEISSIHSWNMNIKEELMRFSAILERLLLAEKQVRN